MKVLLIGLLVLGSIPSFAASEFGNCSLKGAKQATGFVFLPWMKEKQKLQDVTLEECIEKARLLLKYNEEASYESTNASGGPSHEEATTVSIKRVDYKFESSSETVTGSIRNH